MWRWIACFVAAVAGCVATIPAADDITVTADIAAETARMVLEMQTPDASTDCDSCRGTGKIGDGKIVHTCPDCGGTGKRMRSVCVEGCKP